MVILKAQINGVISTLFAMPVTCSVVHGRPSSGWWHHLLVVPPGRHNGNPFLLLPQARPESHESVHSRWAVQAFPASGTVHPIHGWDPPLPHTPVTRGGRRTLETRCPAPGEGTTSHTGEGGSGITQTTTTGCHEEANCCARVSSSAHVNEVCSGLYKHVGHAPPFHWSL